MLNAGTVQPYIITKIISFSIKYIWCFENILKYNLFNNLNCLFNLTVFNAPVQDFVFPTDTNNAAIKTLNYIPENVIPMGANHYRSRMFITFPRRRPGIPATLAYIDMAKVKPNNRSPHVLGYPNYETNTIPENMQPNPDRIISVYRTRIDQCGRLWFIDTGLLEYPGIITYNTEEKKLFNS